MERNFRRAVVQMGLAMHEACDLDSHVRGIRLTSEMEDELFGYGSLQQVLRHETPVQTQMPKPIGDYK